MLHHNLLRVRGAARREAATIFSFRFQRKVKIVARLESQFLKDWRLANHVLLRIQSDVVCKVLYLFR